MKVVRTIALSLAIATGAGAPVPPAGAHHSIAGFDGGRVIEIEGTVVDFRWINPHASITLQGAVKGDAEQGRWTIEMQAPTVLMNDGWTRESLVAGERVTVFANPRRGGQSPNAGKSSALFVGVVLADGRTLGVVDGGPASNEP